MTDNRNDLGKILKQRRVTVPLTLQEMAHASGVSPSHLGRIERGDRFPSARVLRKIAQPLGFGEAELLILAGYLPPQPLNIARNRKEYSGGRLDPYVATVLSQEPPDVQRMVLGIVSMLKHISKATSQ